MTGLLNHTNPLPTRTPTPTRANIPTSGYFPTSGSLPYILDILILPDIKVIATPDPRSLKQVKINQSMKITVELTAKDNHTVLSQLQGSFGQTNASLQQLLGDHNVTCITASLIASDQFNIEPAPEQEYPLNQTSIIWSWIVTPKQTEANLFDISFSVAGKPTCAMDKDPIVGLYSLENRVSYSYTVINPKGTSTTTAIPNISATPFYTSNIFIQAYNELGIGTIITGALTTLLATFVAWICTQAWKQRKGKTKAHTSSKVPAKLDPPSLPTRSRRKSSRHTRKKTNASGRR